MDKANEPEKDESARGMEKVLRAYDIINPASGSNVPADVDKIPRFDLAQEIMAQHRKATANKRKGPGRKIGIEAPPAPTQEEKIAASIVNTEGPTTALSEMQQVIAQIVSKDIEHLCRG